ncbi:protein panoramix [Drosophila bipectinata]|uniref:protein panoramix n=1 Tax=Drosophila bipectinata TaxID=42026 RepID=UPI001C89FABF|nr:protein panoramix [Drosophila bipectinata]
MEQPIKQEVQEVEGQTYLDENDNTPLRERTISTPPHAFAPYVPATESGWESDNDDVSHLSAPRTPGASLQETKPKEEAPLQPKFDMEVDEMLDEMLNEDFNCEEPAPAADTKPPLKSEPSEGIRRTLDGIPSQFTRRESLNDMDLCSLDALSAAEDPSEAESTDALIATKKEILQQLEKVDTELASKPKEKKKKKKHKKDRSHKSSQSKEQSESRKRRHSQSSLNDSLKENKRRRSHGNESLKTPKPDPESDCIPVRSDERQIRLVQSSRLFAPPKQEFVPHQGKLALPDRRNRAMARAELALQLFQKQKDDQEQTEVQMVETVGKLPVSESFRNQDSFENPSPICNNMNVTYAFNSVPGTKIDFNKWGLETVPQATRELLRILGISLERLKQIQMTAKPSQRILKLKKEQMEKGLSPAEDIETATLYKNAATQTEGVSSTRSVETQVRMESQSSGAFWQDPNFDETDLTQQQSNVMFALMELFTRVPDTSWAPTLYKALEPALHIKRRFHR